MCCILIQQEASNANVNVTSDGVSESRRVAWRLAVHELLVRSVFWIRFINMPSVSRCARKFCADYRGDRGPCRCHRHLCGVCARGTREFEPGYLILIVWNVTLVHRRSRQTLSRWRVWPFVNEKLSFSRSSVLVQLSWKTRTFATSFDGAKRLAMNTRHGSIRSVEPRLLYARVCVTTGLCPCAVRGVRMAS